MELRVLSPGLDLESRAFFLPDLLALELSAFLLRFDLVSDLLLLALVLALALGAELDLLLLDLVSIDLLFLADRFESLDDRRTSVGGGTVGGDAVGEDANLNTLSRIALALFAAVSKMRPKAVEVSC